MSVPQAMSEYMSAQGIAASALRDGEQLPLVFDQRYRVRVIPLAGGSLALESRVGPLPEEQAERERRMERALRLACGRMQVQREALVVPADRQSLRLQSRLESGASRAELETLLESHVNALAYWRSALG